MGLRFQRRDKNKSQDLRLFCKASVLNMAVQGAISQTGKRLWSDWL
jgi:hypothetical protein